MKLLGVLALVSLATAAWAGLLYWWVGRPMRCRRCGTRVPEPAWQAHVVRCAKPKVEVRVC